MSIGLAEELIGKVIETLIATGIEAEAEIKSNILDSDIIDSRSMFDSVIANEVTFDGTKARLRLAVPVRHASFQDEGTGVYAGGGPIEGWVTFNWRRQGGVRTSLPRVQGTPKTQFFTKALDAVEHVILPAVWNA